MLIPSSVMRGPQGPTFLDGAGLGGNASVEGLQRALLNLSMSANRPDINPGPIDGAVGNQTMAAVAASINIIGQELPSWLYVALQAALMVGSTTTQAKQYVTQYATPLTVAANAAAVKLKQPLQVMPPVMQPIPTGFFSTIFPTGWYRQPSLGWLIVGVGAFGFYKFFLATPKS